MIVLGHDPGTRNPGLALLAYDKGGSWHCLRSPVLHSLDEYLDALADIMATIRVDVFGIEGVTFAFSAGGEGHGNGSARILESVGATRLAAKVMGATLHQFEPSTWRANMTGSKTNTPHNERVLQKVLRARIRGWPERPSSHRRAAAALAIMAGTVQLQARLMPGRFS